MMESDVVVAHQGTDIRPFEAAIGYVDGPRLAGRRYNQPKSIADDEFNENFFADLFWLTRPVASTKFVRQEGEFEQKIFGVRDNVG